MDSNPYQTPDLTGLQPPPLAGSNQYEAVRQECLSNEASIKGLGSLYVIGSIFCFLGGLSLVLTAHGTEAIMGAVYLAVGALQLPTGLALRKLRPWARIVAIVFSCLGLLGFPVGTIICAYLLYLLGGKKGSMIFSPYYQEVLAHTPHMRYRTSIVVKILLIVILALFAIGAIFAVFAGFKAGH